MTVEQKKQQFELECRQVGVKEVWVNFEEPFDREHNAAGEKMCFIPLQDKCDDSALISPGHLISPLAYTMDERALDSDIIIYAGFEDTRLKTLQAAKVRNDSTFRLLYSEEGGVLFG